MLQKVGILVMIVLALWSCQGDSSANDKVYEGELIRFNLPEDWSIGKVQDIDTMGSHMIMVEKMGEDPSGQITISVLRTPIAPPAYLDILKNQMLQNMPNAGMVFSDPEKGDFNGVDCMQSNFTFAVDGLDFDGALYSFFCQENNSVVVYMQGAEKDLADNKAGFEKMKSTFSCVIK